MNASIVRVRGSLPESKRAEFDLAVQTLVFNQMNSASLLRDGTTATSSMLDNVKSSLNGRTGNQVIAEARRIVSERKAKEREQALIEIKEL